MYVTVYINNTLRIQQVEWTFEPDFNLFLITAVTKITTKLREMGDRLVATNEDIQRSLTQGNTLTERAYADISRSYENLRNEVRI